MARINKKHEWSPYTSDVQRFSVYPRITAPQEEVLKPGMTIVININNIDEKGQGVASYRGKKIIVYNASLGSRVKVKLTKVQGDVAYGEIIQTLSEVDESLK